MSDIQELNIVITTKNVNDRIRFVESPTRISTVNVNDFADQQQWRLLNHTRVMSKLKSDKFNSIDKPFFISSIFACRYPKFYIYKYCLLFFFSLSVQ